MVKLSFCRDFAQTSRTFGQSCQYNWSLKVNLVAWTVSVVCYAKNICWYFETKEYWLLCGTKANFLYFF